MSPSIINNIMNEINILKKLKHKFITQLYEVVDTDVIITVNSRRMFLYAWN